MTETPGFSSFRSFFHDLKRYEGKRHTSTPKASPCLCRIPSLAAFSDDVCGSLKGLSVCRHLGDMMNLFRVTCMSGCYFSPNVLKGLN